MNRKLTIGFYTPTENFKSIPEHIAVMYEDNQGLVALVGASDETPEVVKESLETARLFAASPKMIEALKNIKTTADNAQGEWLPVQLAY